MEQAKFRVVINWNAQQVFDIDASNPNEAEIKAVKMAAYEGMRLKPTINIQQTGTYHKVEPRAVAVVATIR